MTEFANKCLLMMAKGDMPPRNWQERVSYTERTRIYDAYVSYYICLIKNGRELPKRGWCARGLSDEQKERIYAARGFGSTGKMKCSLSEAISDLSKRTERELWLKSHGGQHTQSVIAAAQTARERRREHLYRKYRDKKLRRAISKGWSGITHRYVEWCSCTMRKKMYERKESEMRRRLEWNAIRMDIVNEAIATHLRNKFTWAIRDVIRYYEDKKRMEMCSKIMNGSTKTSDAHAQLRSLGFVA